MSHVLYPAQGETFGALVRRVMNGLAPGARARVQVVTGGERFGLVVPEDTAPPATPQATDEQNAAPRRPGTSRRRATAEKGVTV